MAGSSPLTRGKPAPRRPRARGRGLIPAHAGKTWAIPLVYTRSAAHPRSRGENGRGEAVYAACRGSSPLTRGKPLPARPGQRGIRLIPAHAGKTRSARPSHARGPAHPRSRGENGTGNREQGRTPGSSPLTRGKQRARRQDRGRLRLIPAHAGKTSRVAWMPPEPWAHPRSRGENHDIRVRIGPDSGSSPLTRGKPPRQVHASTLQGLIPAHAGKTVHRRCTTLNVSAHPRSRGENRGLAAVTRSPRGSSPLTRGKLLPRSGSRTPKRLIPAHAGKTHKASARLTRVRAHPRSRGENMYKFLSRLM